MCVDLLPHLTSMTPLTSPLSQYPDTPFVIPANPRLVILPMSLYLESKTHPAADFNAETYERFMGRWTHAGDERDEVRMAIRQDLTKSIGAILP